MVLDRSFVGFSRCQFVSQWQNWCLQHHSFYIQEPLTARIKDSSLRFTCSKTKQFEPCHWWGVLSAHHCQVFCNPMDIFASSSGLCFPFGSFWGGKFIENRLWLPEAWFSSSWASACVTCWRGVPTLSRCSPHRWNINMVCPSIGWIEVVFYRWRHSGESLQRFVFPHVRGLCELVQSISFSNQYLNSRRTPQNPQKSKYCSLNAIRNDNRGLYLADVQVISRHLLGALGTLHNLGLGSLACWAVTVSGMNLK